MRKLFLALLLALMMLITTACVEGQRVESDPNTMNEILLNSGSMFAYTFQDVYTGVWYIATTGGVTERLNSDGSLYITEIGNR